ncbi:MAG: glycosyltransferase family 2 protein [Syntrophaceae bacterium]|nr:glycosyltransferase family 2 protein [Syntrophaceae bacterium]
MNARACIIVPAFNEEKQIAAVIESIRLHSRAGIIVIDDGSRDRTVEVVKETGTLVIRHPFNIGYGVAVQTGYKYAFEKGYDFLLQMDADGQHLPQYIPDLFAMVESKKCDIAIGSRFLGSSYFPVGLLKLMGIRLFRIIIKVTTGQTITDPTSGYRCMNRKVLEKFTEDSFPVDYPDANIMIFLHRMGFRIAELPVTMAPNPEGRYMHQGLLKISYYVFKMFLSILVILLRKKENQ